MEERILEVLRGGAAGAEELARTLRLAVDGKDGMARRLAKMEAAGTLVRIRGDRYVIPADADLVQGVIQFRQSGSAYVVSAQPGGGELQIAAEDTFTAMHGDVVVARIDRAPPEARRAGGPGRGGGARGRVIRVVTRAVRTIVGTLQRSKAFYYVVADDPRFVHNLYVPEPKGSPRAAPGDKVVARFESWPHRHVNPEGRIVEVLGRAGDPGVDVMALMRKYGLPGAFPDAVRREAEELAESDPADEAGRREDLRDRFVLTIDPDDARDFDDAIEVVRTRGGWTVSVHIADVAHYVRPGSALDREARARANSTYLPDRVLPMLPEVLSNGLCSLRPDEDRLAFSVIAEVASNGRVRSARFARTLIRSKARLTYREALARLERPASDEISRALHAAWSLASLLRKNRFEAGSLDLDFPEVKLRLDDDGAVERIERVENDISHQLIEELMLLANELVARRLKLARQPAIYRIHEKPEPDRLEEFRQTAAIFGLKAGDLTHRAELRRLLAAAKGKPFEHALKVALLKSLKRARYAPEPAGHYGLHKADYAHFTSPIRRYADLVVHRALARHLGLVPRGPASRELGAIADHLSERERASADAEREAVKTRKLEFFRRQLELRRPETFRARILEVRNFGLFVEIPDCLVSGLVHVSSIAGDFYDFDPARRRLVGRKSRRVIEAGGELNVVVARVDNFKQQIDFAPA